MSHEAQNQTRRVVSFLLHAHLPYGYNHASQNSLEQAWLYEAVTHCYLPLLSMLKRLEPKDSPWLTVSLSPTLLELWSHRNFAHDYRAHLKEGLRIIESETEHPAHPQERRQRAREIMADWEEAGARFESIDGKLPSAFADLAESGKIELITTAATHAFLPAFQNDSCFRRFQIGNGIETFKRHTGIHPKGFWLPECAYFDGLENDLASYGIEYFGLEEQGLARATPKASIRAPLSCPNGLLALGRDNTLSQKVWSARSGYPGHSHYREFHHDGIHQVDTEICKQFALPDSGRLPFGLKYWRVTGTPEKDWYEPERAKEQAELDAGDFIKEIESTEEGLVFLPFDAELFGHWWYEGPVWLENVLKRTSRLANTSLKASHQAAKSFTGPPQGRPAASTWGRRGDYSFWVNRDTDWIYALLCHCSEDLRRLIELNGPAGGDSEKDRGIRQAGRELLLASASDWPFMLRAGATGEYAMERLHQHIKRCRFLVDSIREERLDPRDLALLEERNPAFLKISLAPYFNRP
ncbi:hypothetical protein DDZ13_04760 [Coraliomargarita sinensis]|uniref:DUF1957 domain-containing protein n=1 Tax=Coraliomargarita sinensis TaxID=2174842 RepID=A0A317ZGD1_9BACT|nr:1,4-alpha-glucan branching protein domain-containing protein [Coraliomargarita sinensis]PXA04490.1 hypothetical protein DDZ13_04760 [Coraliomargarita sinensis]